MKIIKISIPQPANLLLRQSPGMSGIWGDCKFLINSDVEIVKLDNENVLLNANTIEESNRAVELLSDFNK